MTDTDGEYAVVELLGHRTLIGRIAEIERFGTKLLQVECLFNGNLLPPTYHHGTAIYSMTPCSREVALKRQATRLYELPPGLAAVAPPAMLAPPQEEMPFGEFVAEVEAIRAIDLRYNQRDDGDESMEPF